MALRFTPLQIRNQEFSKKLQGYKPEEVKMFLSQVAEFVDNILQENRLLRNEIEALHKRISDLERQAVTIKEAMEGQAQQMISEAEQKARQIISEAEEEAGRIYQEMNTNVEKKREELYELVGIYQLYKQELLRTVRGLVQAIEDFDSSRESRGARRAILKLGTRMKPPRLLDPQRVIANTVHRRKRKAFFKLVQADEGEEE